MRTGLLDSLDQINDSRKTAIIDHELDRLNVDIAALQETRLADSGSLKEKKTTLSSGMARVRKRLENIALALRKHANCHNCTTDRRLRTHPRHLLIDQQPTSQSAERLCPNTVLFPRVQRQFL